MDPHKPITSILKNLNAYLQKLTKLAAYSQSEFLLDFTKVESTKHLLQVSVQCCLDIAHYIIASENYRLPQDSYDALVVLQEQGILPDSFMPTLRQMVSFRNRVVHLYWEVDEAIVYEILQNNLGDFTTFVNYILDFVNPPTDNG